MKVNPNPTTKSSAIASTTKCQLFQDASMDQRNTIAFRNLFVIQIDTAMLNTHRGESVGWNQTPCKLSNVHKHLHPHNRTYMHVAHIAVN